MNSHFDFHQVLAIGWGKTAHYLTVLPKELQEVRLDTIAHESESCKDLIKSKSRQFCASVATGDKGKKRVVIKKTIIFSV